jgi:hypothetical protein
MKRAMLVAMFILAVAGFVMAQNWNSPVDVLGAHNNYGRGCAGCHQPHSGAFGSGYVGTKDSGNYALWGQDASPLYGQTIAFGDGGSFVEVLPSSLTGNSADIGGILLCLSCHDGSVTNTKMMGTGQLYEQKIGLLTNPAYGPNPIPTLLGKDGTAGGTGSSIPGNYNNDHPVGTEATMVSFGSPMQGTGQGVTFNGTNFIVAPGSNYDKFVKNYGYPAIAPGKWGPQYGIKAGVPYVLCTTCHNQHVMTVYTSSTSSPIANDGGGKYYAKLFFMNGPYNPNVVITNGKSAPSTVQFCRQCHFGESNEANNTFTIPTTFQ